MTYEKLKKLQAESEGWCKELTTKQRTLGSLEKKELKHRDTKSSYDKRKLTEDHILTIENAIKWKQFYNCREPVIEAKKEVEERSVELRQLKEKERTVSASLDSYLERLDKARDRLKSVNAEFTKVLSHCGRSGSARTQDYFARVTDPDLSGPGPNWFEV